jgi:hypothetical protein
VREKLCGLLLILLGGCKGGSVDVPDAAQSPQAQAEPAPLAILPAAPGNSTIDAGPAPQPLRGDVELPADVVREAPREGNPKDPPRDPKELGGYVLQAILRTGEGPPAPKGAEVNASAIEAAKRKLEPRIAIEASQTRARFVLTGGFVLPQGTELRARADRYGHLLMWPGEESYRVVEPGALRALLGERRLDVAPLSQADVVASGEGTRRMNMRTRRVDVATRAAKATMELATLRDAGDGGVLVCRLLLDLMSAHPGATACATDEVPLHAELRWTTQGSLQFDVIAVNRRLDIPVGELAAPPQSLAFASSPPPALPGETLLTRGELASFRTAPVETPVARDAQAPSPESGLVLTDSTDELRVAWLDGVAVAWVAPGGRESLPSLVRGHYLLQWRTFLGDAWEQPEALTVPGTSDLGGAAAKDRGP